MTTAEELGRRLAEQSFAFLSLLQTEGEVDAAAFGALSETARSLAVALRGEEVLPRRALNDLYLTYSALLNEAERATERSGVLRQMASELSMTFGLILAGECHGDRTPGVPRVL